MFTENKLTGTKRSKKGPLELECNICELTFSEDTYLNHECQAPKAKSSIFA